MIVNAAHVEPRPAELPDHIGQQDLASQQGAQAGCDSDFRKSGSNISRQLNPESDLIHSRMF
jgi:hypothetical protein